MGCRLQTEDARMITVARQNGAPMWMDCFTADGVKVKVMDVRLLVRRIGPGGLQLAE